MKGIFTLCFILLTTLVPLVTVQASDRITLGINPGTVEEIFLQQGESIELEFDLLNSSQFAGNTPERFKQFTFNVYPVLRVDDDEAIDVEDWASFSVEYLTLAPRELGTIRAEITVPEDVADGFYRLWLEFRRGDRSEGGVRVESALRVPLFVYVGDEWANATRDLDITAIDLLIDGTRLNDTYNMTTIWGETFHQLGRMLTQNPLNVMRDIQNRPVFVFEGETSPVLDINRDINTSLIDVVTHTRWRTSDFRYVYAPSEAMGQIVMGATTDEEGPILFHLENGSAIELPVTETTRNRVNEQLLELRSLTEGSITLEELFRELVVPMNKYYTAPHIMIETDIENTGTLAVRPEGWVYVSRVGNVVGELEFMPVNVLGGDSRSFGVEVPAELSLITGRYELRTEATSHDIEVEASTIININTSLREDVLIRVLILYVLIIVVIVVVLYVVYKATSDKKKKKKNGSATSQETEHDERVKIINE